MTEFHDEHDDRHDDVPEPTADPTDDPGTDAFTGERDMAAPVGDLPAHADAPAELHFPGDAPATEPPAADADPAAPWPDDRDFERWLHHGEDAADRDDPAGEVLLAAPEEGDALPTADELVDWSLRRLGH